MVDLVLLIFSLKIFLASDSFSLIGAFLQILQGAFSCCQGGAIKEPFIVPGYFTDIKEGGGQRTYIFCALN